MEHMALAFAVDTLITAVCLYIAGKLVFLDARAGSLFAVIIVVSLVSLVPYVGWALGLCLLALLLAGVTSANIAQCTPVAVLTKLFALSGVFLIRGVMA